MRISTAAFHRGAMNGMGELSTALARTQAQIATGKRLQSPADDPAAAVHILDLERALAESQQFARNANMATNRLSLEEHTLAGIADLLQRVRDLTLQANSGTMDRTSRETIAIEIQGRLQELIDLANSRDASGEYLFAGFSTGTQPFVRDADRVIYAGDQGTRMLQTSPTQRIAVGHSGFDVFMNVRGGQDIFATLAGLDATLRRDTTNPAERTQFDSEIHASLTELDATLDHLSGIRAQVGSRLSALENSQASRQDLEVSLETWLSQLEDLDYAEAITRMNQQLAGLQAAQAAYIRIAGLSLFNHL